LLTDRAFAELFRRVPSPLIVRSLESEAFLEVNQAFEKLTGFQRDELVGQTPAKLGIFDAIHHHEENVQKVAMTGSVLDRKGKLRCKDGSLVEVTFSSVRMVLDGKLVAVSILRRASPPD
jgi:PAS domain S-box-containing protein